MNETQSCITRSADNIAGLIEKQFPETKTDRTETDGKITVICRTGYPEIISFLENNGCYAEAGSSNDAAIYFDDQHNAWITIDRMHREYGTATRLRIS